MADDRANPANLGSNESAGTVRFAGSSSREVRGSKVFGLVAWIAFALAVLWLVVLPIYSYLFDGAIPYYSHWYAWAAIWCLAGQQRRKAL
jgi:hypothetical protein